MIAIWLCQWVIHVLGVAKLSRIKASQEGGKENPRESAAPRFSPDERYIELEEPLEVSIGQICEYCENMMEEVKSEFVS